MFLHATFSLFMATVVLATAQVPNTSRESEIARHKAWEERQAIYAARAEKGLWEAAKFTGSYTEGVDFSYELEVEDLYNLAALSGLVIKGFVESSRPLIGKVERGFPKPIETILSDYTFHVVEVFKGASHLVGRDVVVRIPGGRVEFADGTWAEIQVIDFPPPRMQQEFFLFLEGPGEDEGVYSLTFNRQGAFAVEAPGLVIPRTTSISQLAKTSKRDYREFVEQLRQAVTRLQGRLL